MSSMMVKSEEARLETIIKFSLCCLVNSDSSVRTVMPMIPFMGVLHVASASYGLLLHASTLRPRTDLISCDMFAKNSDLLLLAVSASCLATVFFSILSRRL